ncbi:hypothetical protein [uncultured Sphingomonas sp.]|uniref:hypothetical protein n=1 Tax=uncultured Sphingomonas sp. TaxID=158754 RepID=UPI0025DB03ED|nr:hypothetical protein [uncultured Sphingomonas sp.]
MATWYKYAIARLAAHPARDERLNVGLVVFAEGRVDARPARNLEKIKAISYAIDPSRIRESFNALTNFGSPGSLEEMSPPEDLIAELAFLTPFHFSALGQFEAHSHSSYEESVKAILGTLVEPEPAPIKRQVRRSKLLTSIKSALRQEGVLARRGEDLTAHRVVAGWPLAEGLSADLVLQNGAMHVFETIDADSTDVSKRKVISEIGISALVLEQARMLYGEASTKSRLVYTASASNETLLGPALHAAEHQGAQLVNWSSHDDRQSLLVAITKAATPIERSNKARPINASTQSQFKLN